MGEEAVVCNVAHSSPDCAQTGMTTVGEITREGQTGRYELL
jgi:hypothetical protein